MFSAFLHCVCKMFYPFNNSWDLNSGNWRLMNWFHRHVFKWTKLRSPLPHIPQCALWLTWVVCEMKTTGHTSIRVHYMCLLTFVAHSVAVDLQELIFWLYVGDCRRTSRAAGPLGSIYTDPRAPVCSHRVGHPQCPYIKHLRRMTIERNQVRQRSETCLHQFYSKTCVYMQFIANPISSLPPAIFFSFFNQRLWI